MLSSQLYMINRKAVPKLARRRTVASTWHDIIRCIFTLRYRWPETSCDLKIWRLCLLTKLYIMSSCNEWSAGSPTRRTVDMTQHIVLQIKFCTTPVLPYTTKYYSNTTLYYSSTTFYYKVLLQYYPVLQSTS